MRRKTLFFLLTMLYLLQVDGQYSLTRTYTEEDGLAPGIVNVISQDQYGYNWIGTRNGLSKFDGRNFTTYFGDVSDSLALKSSEIFDLCHTNDGNMWIATSSGLSYYDRKTNHFRNYNQEDGIKMDVIKRLVQQNDSILWIGHWFGVDRINVKNWNVTSFSPAGPQSDTILYHHSPNHIKNLKLNKNSILISHSNQIKIFDSDKEEFINIFEVDAKIEGNIDDFYFINNNEILVTTGYDQNYYLVNLSNGDAIKKSIKSPHKPDDIVGTQDGDIVLLDRYQGPKFYNTQSYAIETITDNQGDFIETIFTSIFIDSKKRIWTGTFDGIYIFEPDANKYYVQENYSISSTVFDPIKSILIGVDEKAPLVYKNDKGKLTLLDYDFKNINPYGIIYSELVGSFLSFNNETYNVFDPLNNTKNIRKLSQKIEGYINQIKEVEKGYLICAGEKVYKVDIKGNVDIVVEYSKRIFSAYEYDGGFFYSCIGNLFYFKDGNNILVHQQGSFTRARGMTITGDTSLWFTEIYKGLLEIDLRDGQYSVSRHSNSEGLNSQIMYGIYRDGDNFLIPATYCFYIYDPKKQSIVETYKKGHKYSSYDLAYDIYSIDENHYASGVAPGIMVFPKKAKQAKISDLRLQLINVGNDEAIYDIPSELELDYFENDINIQLESCYYGEKNEISYYYRVNDEVNYKLLGSSTNLNLNNLPPGTYQIHIKANSNNHESELLNAITIIINPPWWATKWFILGCFLIVGSSIMYWYLRRMKHLKSQHEIEKKLIHLESIALKSQINPHFLFNSLNGIRTLISLQENEKAIKYVSHLSQLLRDSLTYHQVHVITLAQELEMNRHYLELEKLRYNEKLNWIFKKEENVDLNEIKIPPFTLQPLIENAIHHGIRYIEGIGKIEIFTSEDDGHIKISVTDNGIGLKKSAELQKGKIRLRDHIGLSIVEKRITSLNGKLSIKDRSFEQGVEATIVFKSNTK